jgi:hypothetical protein
MRPTRPRIILLSGIASIALGVVELSVAAPGGSKPVPPFASVQQAVWRYFQARPDFQPADLITREDVAPLLIELRRKGLPLADAEQILEKVPAAGEFLVDQLSTPNGRKFMRRIAVYPNGYDRIDRLSRLPLGQQTVRDLIRGPGGEKMIAYMTTASGGKELGKMLSNNPEGKHFNAPTGRIYTVAMLLDRLKQSQAAALKAPGKSGKL